MGFKDILDTAFHSLQSILRNKRRSTAMVAGIILGVSILSGIIIYTEVLQQENFESIVDSAEYEVSFKVIESVHGESHLWDVSSLIQDDVRIESSTVITGPRTSVFDSEKNAFVLTISSELEDLDPESELSAFTPLFVRDNFTETSISDKITSSIVGSFNLTSTETNQTVIPEIIATQFNLQVGSIIEHINITVAESIERGPNAGIPGKSETFTIENVEVTGIYSASGGSAGLFANFESSKFYFNTAILDRFGENVIPLINEYKYQYLAVKINSNEFTITDLDLMNTEINTLINDISQLAIGDSGDTTVEGTNEIEQLLGPFEILNILLIIFDVILVLPLVILCLYLLSFGLELALEERKREIGIFKVQGADSKQIFTMIRNESLVLFSLGATIGYLASIFGAWIIGSATGFMEFDLENINQFTQFVSFNVAALVTSVLIILAVLTINVYKKGREFIDLEVTEAVQRGSKIKKGFFRRNNLDIFMVAYGLLAGLINILIWETQFFEAEFFKKINFDPNTFIWTLIIDFLGIIFLWLGAAISGARVAKWLPQKSERLFLSLPKLKNVALIIRSGLKRRGDIDNLVFIIVLTLSISTLAGIQGVTDQALAEDTLEYNIGADYKITFSSRGNRSADIMQYTGVKEVMELPTVSASVLSSSTTVYGMNPEIISSLLWHDLGFEEVSLDKALAEFKVKGDTPKVMIGTLLAEELTASIGDEINLRVKIADPVENVTDIARLKVKVIGTFNHAPGGVDQDSIVANFDTITELQSLIANETLIYEDQIPANTYLVNAKDGVDKNKLERDFTSLEGYNEIRNVEREISEIGQENNYGIPGLLTMMYLTSLIASIISAFAFSAIIMERRKREFAVLQTVGATSTQIYTTAFGENFLVMLTSVIWGTIAGLGLSYLMNGFFAFIGEFLGRGELPRTIVLEWNTLIINGLIILIGMLSATLVSVITSVRQDLTEATRTI